MSNRVHFIQKLPIFVRELDYSADVKYGPIPKKLTYSGLRRPQKEAYHKCKDAQFWMYVASGGSGKSKGASYIASYDLLHSNRKVIFAVPQEAIAQDFAKAITFVMPDGQEVAWTPEIIFSGAKSGTLRAVEKTLNAPAHNSSFQNRIVVCSHKTLVALYHKHGKKLLRNVHLVIDEAHHVCIDENSFDETDNLIGKLVGECGRTPPVNFRLGFVTATFFRGDTRTILPEDIYGKFVRYDYLVHEHLHENTEIETISYNIALYAGDFDKEVARLVKQKAFGKAMFAYAPQSNAVCSLGSKEYNAERLIAALPRNGTYLNFVLEKNQKRLKRMMVDSDGDVEADAIVSVGMNKEGTNWVCADTVLMVGNKRSITEVLQIIERTFRNYPGKRHVTVWHLIPYSFKKTKPEEMREHINNYLKVVFGSMVVADALQLLKLKIPHGRKSKGKKRSYRTERLDYIQKLIPDESVRHKFYQDVLKDTLSRVVCDGKEIPKPEKKKVLLQVAETHLEDAGLDKKHAAKVARQIWYRHAATALMMQRDLVAVDGWDIDLLDEVDPFAGVYNSKNISLREICASFSSRNFYSINDLRSHAERMGGECLEKEYLGLKEYHKWRCRCGFEWPSRWATIKMGHWCPKCAGNAKVGIEKVKELAASFDFSVVDNVYISGEHPMRFRCNKCGSIKSFQYRWFAIVGSLNCSVCGKGHKEITTEYIRKLAEDRGLELIGEYKDSRTRIKFRCKKCNSKFDHPYKSLLKNKKACPLCMDTGVVCRKQTKGLSREQIDWNSLCKKNGFVLIKKYRGENRDYRVKVRCLTCGKENDASCGWFKSSIKCPYCGAGSLKKNPRMKYTTERLNKAGAAVGLSLVGEYNPSKKKQQWMCDKCGKPTVVAAHSVLLGHGCGNRECCKKIKHISETESLARRWKVKILLDRCPEYPSSIDPIYCECEICRKSFVTRKRIFEKKKFYGCLSCVRKQQHGHLQIQ